MATRKNINRTAERLRQLTGDDKLADELGRMIAKRQVIKHFMVLRSAAGMSQAEIARAMRCSQSRVSKLESSVDRDWRLGDVEDYLGALGLEPTIVIAKRNMGLADRIKATWAQLVRLLEELRGAADGDPDIERGIGKFSCDIAFNFFSSIASFISRLPAAAKAHAPQMKIEVLEDSLNDEPVLCRMHRLEEEALSV